LSMVMVGTTVVGVAFLVDYRQTRIRLVTFKYRRETKGFPRAWITFVLFMRTAIKFGDSYTCTYCLRVVKYDHHRSRLALSNTFSCVMVVPFFIGC
jgi:hypothetical protein